MPKPLANQDSTAVTLDAIVSDLEDRYGDLEGPELVQALSKDARFHGKIAAKTSAGADAALVLDAVAQANPDMPVLFADTGKLHKETLGYLDTLKQTLGLRNIHRLKPEQTDLERVSMMAQSSHPGLEPWITAPSLCCEARKVFPMDRAIADGNYLLVISGQKAAGRSGVKIFEAAGNHIIVNPFAKYDRERANEALKAIDVPEHPLVEKGFTTIGCETCTVAGKSRFGSRWVAHNQWREEQLANTPWKEFFQNPHWDNILKSDNWQSMAADPSYAGLLSDERWTCLFEDGQGEGRFDVQDWIKLFHDDKWQSLFRDDRYLDFFTREEDRNVLFDPVWQTSLFPMIACGINANERKGPPPGYNFVI